MGGRDLFQGRLVVAFILLLLVGCGGQQREEEIKIGFIAPLTGPFADWGKSIQNGLELALNDTDHKFVVDYQDSVCDPKQTLNIATKFFDIEDIKIIIGPGCVTGLRAIAPLADKKQALLFSTGLLDDQIFEEYNSVINLATQISTEVQHMAVYLKSRDLKKVAVIHGTNYFGEEYGRSLPEALKGEGIEVTRVERSDLDTTDFRTAILKLMEDDPEAVFIHQGETQIGLFAKQMTESGHDIPIYTYYGAEAESVIQAGGDSLEGIQYTYPYNSAETSEKKKIFEEKYKNKYQSIPTATSFFVYDGLQLIDQALDVCNPKDTPCIKTFFVTLGKKEGISGLMKFENDGSLTRQFGVKEIRDGEFVWVNKQISLK